VTLILMKHRITKFDRNALALSILVFWFEEAAAVDRCHF
jgi:hypothetical protein